MAQSLEGTSKWMLDFIAYMMDEFMALANSFKGSSMIDGPSLKEKSKRYWTQSFFPDLDCADACHAK